MNTDSIIDDKLKLNLPVCRGKVSHKFSLSKLSWLKVGGPAQVLFQPADEEDLSFFLKNLPAEIPIFVIGACSNLIIRDGGIPGIVVKLGRNFSRIEINEHSILAGAACPDAHVARISASNGVDLSFLRTIPGNIGGAVAMNAGCYGSYISDYFLSLRAVLRDGTIVNLNLKDLNFHYRGSSVPDGAIITEVNFRTEKNFPGKIEKKMIDALAYREINQPVKELSCGSTFRNPLGRSSTGRKNDADHSLKAWKLIDEAGLRGMSIGGAKISTKHPNFMINTGDATAKDLEDLGNLVINRVKKSSGIELIWEIKRVGFNE